MEAQQANVKPDYNAKAINGHLLVIHGFKLALRCGLKLVFLYLHGNSCRGEKRQNAGGGEAFLCAYYVST